MLSFHSMIFQLAIKNITARKSSIVIIAFIAFAIMLLVATNAVFDSTEHGIEETFTHSFAGDVVIRPISDIQLSLFGDDTPVTGELSSIPPLIPFEDIAKVLSEFAEITEIVPQVSGRALMEGGGQRLPMSVFGVDGEKYAKMMSAMKITEGKPFAEGEKGLMLSKKHADSLKVKIGDKVQFSVADGISFRIRAVPLSAVYEYAVENATLDKIAIIDAPTLRELLDLTETVSSSESEGDFGDEDALDSFFEDAEDTEAESLNAEEWSEVATIDFSEGDVLPPSTTWNFIICRLSDPRDTARVMKALNKTFRALDYPAEAVNWRKSAGSTAIYLYWMRVILNAGILIVLFAGFIVINNTLVINVLDRIREIGTMRAIGAQKRFVSAMCMTETLILAISAGIFGVILGGALCSVINSYHIPIHNAFLIQLFGGAEFLAKITARNIFRALATALALGLLSWIYPVKAALSAIPVQAMQGGGK